MNNTTKRLFIGCAIDLELTESWLHLLNAPHNLVPKSARQTNPSNAHLTLAFLGDTSTELIPTISRQLENSIHTIDCFNTVAIKIDHFPGPKGKIIAAYLRLNLELAQLYHAINSCLKPTGHKKEHKSFIPHVTLIRLNKPQPHLSPITLHPQPHIDINKIILYESLPHHDGSSYEPVVSVSLTNKG